MQKLHRLFILLLGFTLALSAHAEEKRYVSDELSAYIRSGPNIKNRIIGSLNAGEEVTLISPKADNGFLQIQDRKGRSSWILASELSTIPSLRERLPAMEQEINTLTEKLSTIDDRWNERTAELQNKVATSDKIIHDLKEENSQLRTQLTVAAKKVDAAEVQLNEKQREIILQWFAYGGGVAGIGLILGLLLPYMIPRRKKKDRWMN